MDRKKYAFLLLLVLSVGLVTLAWLVDSAKTDYRLQSEQYTQCFGYWLAMQRLANCTDCSESERALGLESLTLFNEVDVEFFRGTRFPAAIRGARLASIVTRVYAQDPWPTSDEARQISKAVEPEVKARASEWEEKYLEDAGKSSELVQPFSLINSACVMFAAKQVSVVNKFRQKFN